jgi:NADP-dependent 3-hydroxy acid dehydrogenase YdfG
MKTKNKTIRTRTVLVTGASSGIGKATALYLAGQGVHVYAGVRKNSDKEKLLEEGSATLTPVILDVCQQESIDKAYELISREIENSEFSLVNNAGLSLNGPLEILPQKDIENLINVNVLGLLAVTRAFIPLIRNSQGRLINISSGHGLLAIPDKSVYAASKSAVQAITDSLRLELRPFGVRVSSVVVGKVNTSVLGKILGDREKMISQADPEILSHYLTLIEYFDKEVKNIPGIEAIEVARVISDAILEEKPKTQYLVGPGAKKMKMLSRFPVKMRDNMLYKAIHK